MIGAEEDLEGGGDNQCGGTLKPRKEEMRRVGNRNRVRSCQMMMITGESQRIVTDSD